MDPHHNNGVDIEICDVKGSPYSNLVDSIRSPET